MNNSKANSKLETFHFYMHDLVYTADISTGDHFKRGGGGGGGSG